MTEPTAEILVGGAAFKAMLSHINPSEKLPKLIAEVKTVKSVSKRDNLIKQIKYLDGLHRMDLKAEDAYIMHNVPVIPPRMRPVSIRGANRIEFADQNLLLKDSMVVNNALKGIVDYLPPEELTKERMDLYNGVKAISGMTEAISPNSRGRNVKGLLRQIAGTGGPKTGLFQSKVLSKKQDFSGRAVIFAEPALEFDEASVPVDQLWVMYKFHILRDLAKQGYDYVNSEKAWKERTPAAQKSFNKMIKEVPLIINRAPTLMKTNIAAVRPVPTTKNAMGLNPLHNPNFAADYDGDAFQMYVPMTPTAVKEANDKLLMHNQIHDYRKGLNQSIAAPAHEAILGSMHLTEPDMTQKTVHFHSELDCLKALKEGKIKENTPVEIGL